MKKILSIIITGILIASVFVGCGNEKKEQSTNNTNKVEENKNENPIEGFKTALEKAGLTVGKNETLAYEMVGATSGQKFKVNGELLEVYYYDESKLNDEGKKYLEEAKKGNMDVSGFSVPVVCKGDLVLARLDDHKDKDKIIEVLNSYKQ
ncbi:TPA: hypothetical protein K8N32_002759 [Clostridium perfringens]|nr:hypothetical protein [Clostridium perfringens]HBI7039743.1 hypothetical protein [Clostridium perfringens]